MGQAFSSGRRTGLGLGRSVPGIVAGLTLAVCAGPAMADDVGNMTLQDMVQWIDEYSTLVMAVLSLVAVIILWRIRVLQVGGLNSGGRDVTPIPSLMWLFAGLATLLAFAVGGQAAFELLNQPTDPGAKEQAIQAVLAAGTASLFGLGILWFVHQKAPESGSKFDWVDLPLGVGLFIVVIPLIMLSVIVARAVALGLGTVKPDPLAHNTLRLIAENRNNEWAWVLIAAIVLLVPIAEELIYRVFFQSMFLRIMRSRWAAVFVTSFLFMIAHWTVVPVGGKHALMAHFALALALGASYERTGRLGVPIVMHACFNAFNIFLAFVITPITD